MAGGHPLFEVFVRITQEGMDEVRKSWTDAEKQLQEGQKQWDDFVNKKLPKDAKKIKKELTGITETFGKITEKNDALVKSVEDGSKKQVTALGKVSEALTKISDQQDRIRKGGGLGLDASMTGGDETISTLDEISKRLNELKGDGGTVTIRFSEEGADDLIGKLETTHDLVSKINDDGTVTIQVDHSQLDDLNTRLDDTQALSSETFNRTYEMNVDSSSLDGLSDKLNTSRDSALGVAAAIGGDGNAIPGGNGRNDNSIGGSLRKMNADAKAATALPSLLGDLTTQLSQWKTLAAAVAATAVPALIASVGALTGAAGVAAAGLGALATALTVGLVGGAAQVGSAMISAGGAIEGLNLSAQAAIGNVLGMGKSFGSLAAETKFAEGQVKALTKLVEEMPAGTEAATQAQARLSQALEYQQRVVQEQIRWWNEYGAAAVELGGNFQDLRFALFQIVSDVGGRLIPVLNDFVEIGQTQVPNVALAMGMVAKAADEGTASLREWLSSAEGMSVMTDIFEAMGRAAYPTFKGISDGLILAAELSKPMIQSGQQILETLQQNITAAAEWSQTVEGQQGINDAWAIATDYANKLGTAVWNVGEALARLGAVFISSGLADQMINGLVAMTESIRQFAIGAQQADSKFQQFLGVAGPILSAANEALGRIVSELGRVIYAISTATDEATGMNILVEILNGIRDAADDVADLLINTFTQLGPIIAQLIPELAEFFKIFLGSTPELKIFLQTFTDLLSYFNALPDSVQMVIGRMIAWASILSLVGGATGIGGLISSIIELKFQMQVLSALGVESTFSRIAGAASNLAFYIHYAGIVAWEAVTAISALELALLGLAAAAVVYIIISIDWNQVYSTYSEAREAGAGIGQAANEGVQDAFTQFTIGQLVDQYVLQPIRDAKTSVGPIGHDIIQAFFDAMANTIPGAGPLARSLVDTFTEQVEAGSGQAESSGETVADAALTGFSKGDAEAATKGETLVYGYIKAVSDGAGGATVAGESVSQEVLDALNKVAEAKATGADVVEAHNAAIRAGATEAQASAAEASAGVVSEWKATPSQVNQALATLTPEMLQQFTAAHAAVANVTAEFAATIRTNYEAVQTNVGIMFDNISATIEEKGSGWATSAQTAVDGVTAVFDTAGEGWSTSFAGAVDGVITELDRLASDGVASAQAGVDAINSTLEALQSSMPDSISPGVDAVVAEFDRMNTETVASLDTLSASVTDSLTTLSTDAQQIVTDLVDAVLAEWDRLNSESDTKWSELYDTITQRATEIYDEVVGGSIFPDLVDGSLDEWNRLNDDSAPIWQALGTGIITTAQQIHTQVIAEFQAMRAQSTSIWNQLANDAIGAMQRAKAAILDRSPVPDLVNGVAQYFWQMHDGVIAINEDTVDTLIKLWNNLSDETRFSMEDLTEFMRDELGIQFFEDLSATTQEGMNKFQGVVDEGIAQVADGITVPVEDTLQTVVDLFGQMKTDTNSITDQTVQGLVDLWNQLPEDVRRSNQALAQEIHDTLGTGIFDSDLQMSVQQGMDRYQAGIETPLSDTAQNAMVAGDQTKQALLDPIQQAATQVPGQMQQFGDAMQTGMQGVNQQAAQGGQQLQQTMGQAFQTIAQEAIQDLVNIRDVLNKLLSFMGIGQSSPALGSGAGGGTRPGGTAPAPTGGTQPVRRARGGLDMSGAQPQGPTGGISDGVNPRVVYGEQTENTPETYIVWNRPDNEMLLPPTAAAFGGVYLSGEQASALGIEGMARGGHRRRGAGGGGNRGHRRRRRRGHGGHGGHGGRGNHSNQIGKRFGQIPNFHDHNKKKKRRKKKSKKAGGGGKGFGTAPGATPTGTGGAPETTENASTGGEQGTTSESTSPSTQAFPSSCGGLYPVSSPTDPATQTNTDAALTDSALQAVPAEPSSGADHVNAPVGATGGDASGCGIGGSGSAPTTPWDSNSMMPSGSSGTATSPYDQCGPTNLMANGGMLPSSDAGGASTDAARTLVSAETQTGLWNQFLGFSWFGDPSTDWPLIEPPQGWDPTAVYGDPLAPPNGTTSGMRRGGVLRNGVRYFQAGGLNAGQLQAGLDAGSSVMGSPYIYGDAGGSGGFDCSGLWQYIYEAVAYGAPTPGPRYMGTYAFAAGVEGMSPGEVPGAMNVHVDLTGWVGDGTHMSGNIMGSGFESTMDQGVHGGDSVGGSDGVWTMGDAAQMTGQLPTSGTGLPFGQTDPSGMMSQEVGDWWNCQSAQPLAGQATGPVQPWSGTLPGMTQGYLDQVGQGTLGASGTPTGTSTRDWIIAALNGLGMAPDETTIGTLESLIGQESSGDPNATSPDGAMGLLQMMPDTWAQYGSGDPYNPVDNIMGSIRYQLARYGSLVNFSPYAEGAMVDGAHLGMVGEDGPEVIMPLKNPKVHQDVQNMLGMDSMTAQITARLDRLTARLDYQTDTMGERVAGGVRTRIERDPKYHRSMSRAHDMIAMRDLYSGRV